MFILAQNVIKYLAPGTLFNLIESVSSAIGSTSSAVLFNACVSLIQQPRTKINFTLGYSVQMFDWIRQRQTEKAAFFTIT